VGDSTDIVEKEIYSFADKGGDQLALRPEATASVVRAYLQHGLFNQSQPVRLYSFVNAFRYDRPQAGRFREFHQFNCEAIGEADPLVDADVIALLWRLYADDLGLRGLSLQLNSIGDPVCRPGFIEALVAYYRERLDRTCADCRRRLETNPLRLLDCKQPGCQPLIEGAPRTVDHLCGDCAEHFERLQSYLRAVGIEFVVNPRLVRGLDYYTRTVFEVWPPEVGGQSTLGGGGRYDGLAEQLGGRPTPGVGFATGLERMLLNLERQGQTKEGLATDMTFLVPLGQPARLELQKLADQLRSGGCAAVLAVGERSLRAQLRQANALGARWAVITGDQELESRSVSLRDLASGEQESMPLGTVVARIAGQSR
jgi:histidyl-tRNA synthetase